MKFKASINIMPLEALLDPQGKAVGQSMGNLDINGVSNVRVGKHITLLVDSEDESSAKKIVEEACTKLLCNQIMESFKFTLEEA